MALCDYNCYSPSLCGINPDCATQLPGSELVIQPSPVSVTMPGVILSTGPEPATVVQYNPCASGYGGYYPPGYGCGYGLGYGRKYRYGSSYPCSYPGYSRRCSYSSCGPC